MRCCGGRVQTPASEKSKNFVSTAANVRPKQGKKEGGSFEGNKLFKCVCRALGPV